MTKPRIFLLMGAALLLTACDYNPLDSVPPDSFDEEFIFTNTRKARDYVHDTYNVLPYGGSDNNGYNRLGSGEAMMASASDEAMPNLPGLSVEYLTNGSLSPTSPNPDNPWDHYYQSIRAINIGLENIDLMPEQDSRLRDQWSSEMRVLRAFAHFELVKRFGGIPIVTEILHLGGNLNIPRNSFESSIEFIVRELDESVPNLLAPQEATETEFGRVSAGAALALKSRVLLYAASDLFNGSGYDGSSNPLISYGSYSSDRWVDAAEAAAEVINMGYYEIHAPEEITDDQGDETVLANGESNYRSLFYTLSGNRELILSRTSPVGNEVEKKNFPVGYTEGQGTTNPSQQIVDAYGMLNGKNIEHPDSEYDPDAPYQNRDPRFEASIFYNGKSWGGRGVETFVGGLDEEASNSTKTGYYLSKFMNSNVRISGNENSTNHCFPLIRYAEVLLNYAEAVNEAYGPDGEAGGTGLTAREAVELVRQRVLRPADANIVAQNKDAMRQVIRNERRVELAFEDHRHLDVKRWMTAEESLGEDLNGISITKIDDENLEYDVQTGVSNRVFNTKMYLYPIPINEISRNDEMVQNPLW